MHALHSHAAVCSSNSHQVPLCCQVPACDPSTFFPVEVNFTATKTLCDTQVRDQSSRWSAVCRSQLHALLYFWMMHRLTAQPLQIHAPSGFSDSAYSCTAVCLQVVSVNHVESGEPVKFAYVTLLETEEYSVA